VLPTKICPVFDAAKSASTLKHTHSLQRLPRTPSWAVSYGTSGQVRLHFGRDRYRLIWQVNGSEAEVIVLRVGRKATSRGTIYQEGRPS
jgi:mRNA-degrading endonuclease RelE of RelBE toxin-antitoxin system